MRRTSRYGGCRPNCTAGREKMPPAGSVTCIISSTTRRFSCTSSGTRVIERRGEDPGSRQGHGGLIEARIGVVTFLGHIRDALKAGEFQPVHVRQVMIPKASGKLRKLGIPTVADRVVQTSLKLVLEPISRRISCRARMGSALTGGRTTRSPRSIIWPRSPSITAGCLRPTSPPVRRDRAYATTRPDTAQDEG